MAKKLKKKPIKPEVKIEDEGIKKTKIRVIGIGGGGGNIVSEIASKISKASFVAANTDSKSLKSCSRKVIKFQFGQNLTHGLGTGMNPELGKEAAQSEKERIRKLCQGQDLCILVASLGGGTGSGAISTFAKISKNLGNLTYGIFTLPFKFEGEKKMEIAINSLKEAKNHLNAMTIIPNERVFQLINQDTPLKEALSAINKFLSESLGGLIETIYEPGLINIDFADFKTILEGRGKLAYLNTIEAQRKACPVKNRGSTTGEGEGVIKGMVAKVLNSPLYPYTIRGAKGVLLNIAGEKDLSLADVNQISKTISELVHSEAKIIFGISQRKKYSHIIKTILLATGCLMRNERKVRRMKKRKKKSVIEKPSVVEPRQARLKIKVAKKAAKEEKPQESEVPSNPEEKVRKNGLQIKKEVEELEKEMLEKEKIWEKPAFLRKKLKTSE